MSRLPKSRGELAGAALKRIHQAQGTYLFPRFTAAEDLTYEWARAHNVPLPVMDDLRRDTATVLAAFGRLPWRTT